MHELQNVRTAQAERTVGTLTADDLGRRISLGIVEGHPLEGTLTKINHEPNMLAPGSSTWIGLVSAHGWRYYGRHDSTRPVTVGGRP